MAVRAGVSIRTVSNVVTGSVPVRPATRSRVESAIGELGYRPNLAARGLRSGRAGVIGLVLPDITLPFFREFADAVLAEANARGFSVVVEQTGGDRERERSVLHDPGLRHVDGIVFAAVGVGAADFDRVHLPPHPVVLAGARIFESFADTVALDEYGAGHAVGTLLGQSSSRPAMIVTGNPQWPIGSSGRFRGFVDGLRQHGLRLDPPSIIPAPSVTIEAGQATVARMLESDPRVDAVFAGADALALGALRGLRDAGLSVPEDVAVVGFGNVEYAAHSTPSLTTVDTSRAAMAEAAIRLLVDRLDSRSTDVGPRHVGVDFRLIERESTRARR